MVVNNEHLLLFKLLSRGVVDLPALYGILGMAGTKYHYDRYIEKARRQTREVLPDFCLGCYHDFGTTIGGRVRKGCPFCQQEWLIESEVNKKLVAWTLLTQDATDYLLCHVYKEANYG